MAKAFHQHLLMWTALFILATGIAAGSIWLTNRASEQANPLETEDTAQKSERQIPPRVKLTKLIDGLYAPVDIASTGIGGDSSLFVVEQGGLIRMIDNGQIEATPVLDLSDRVLFNGEQGLLGLVFDPDFQTNKYFYVNYIEPTNSGRRTVVSRFTMGNDGQADGASEKIILRVEQPYKNHNAGDLNFGPDGYLYVGFGDGGSGGDPEGRAQNPKTLLGKMIRIDVHSDSAYRVPGDNPFVNDTEYLPEIWSTGWRNPWRFSFDSKTGDMWIGDVGQSKFEEVDHEPAGKSGRNYGWRCYEGVEKYNAKSCQDKSSYTFPVEIYEHEAGEPCGGSISGGYVYRGQQFPQLEGFYFYADYCKGRLYALDSTQPTYTANLINEGDIRVSTFGVDNQGELYLADVVNGVIYQLVAN